MEAMCIWTEPYDVIYVAIYNSAAVVSLVSYLLIYNSKMYKPHLFSLNKKVIVVIGGTGIL